MNKKCSSLVSLFPSLVPSCMLKSGLRARNGSFDVEFVCFKAEIFELWLNTLPENVAKPSFILLLA